MAGNLQQRLDSIRDKAEKLTSRYRQLSEEKRAADNLISDLRMTIRHQQRELAELRQKIEYLTVVTTITPERDKVEQTRVVLAELVREIDKCINELTQ